MLKQIVIAACLALPLAALAADEKMPAEEKKATPQQQKMAACNKEAGEKKMAGGERKAFMKECLSAGSAKAAPVKAAQASASPAKTKQQEKMAACNKEAGEKALKGDERKKFMSGCLKAA
jgi:hypothetical protein